MDTRRLRLDAFTLALGALIALTIGFAATGNGGGVVMGSLAVGGLIAARTVGFPNRTLVPLVVGAILILWMVWIGPRMPSGLTSALAHTAGGALAGWALAEYFRARLPWPRWASTAVLAVFALVLLWELGELIGDFALGTALNPDSMDSLLDIALGALAGTAAIGLARLLGPRPGSVAP